MKNKKKIIAALVVVLVIVVIILAVVLGKRNAAESTSGQKVYISTDVVKTQDIEAIISTKGTVRAKESVDVYSDISSEVASVNVIEGQQVKKGDALMVLDTEALDNQIRDAELAVKIATLNMSSTSTEAGKIAADNAKQRYELAKRDYENAEVLFESGAISQHDLTQSKVAYDEAYYAYTTAVSAQASDKTSTSVMALQLENSQNTLKDLLALKDKSVIVAPIDGTVTALNAEALDLVTMVLFVKQN